MSLGTYTFLPWLRRGIANQLDTAATATSRASLAVALRVRSDQNKTGDVPPRPIALVGPGDIVGVHRQMVLKTEPCAGITNFEPNYLVYVDFYDEDFPWRYTPDKPDTAKHRLTPWLTLLVLRAGEFRRVARPGQPLDAVELSAAANLGAILPPANELWAWAHVHLNGSLGPGHAPNLDVLTTLLQKNPDLGYSRLLSPRRLTPDTRYHAFLIPTFEVGRLAGLGQPVPKTTPGLALSFASARSFPIYYDWTFGTGSAGDFEDLVRALQPRDIDPRVGVRELDIRNPGFHLPAATGQPNGVVGLEGVLLAPTAVPIPPAKTSNLPAELAKSVNLPADVQTLGTGTDEDPLISAPLYGRWHALVERAESVFEHRNWINELNTDPRYRAVAGMGTRVVQKHQEEYMKLAWKQIGDVLPLNRRVRGLQLAVKASSALYAKSLAALPAEHAIAFATPVLSKVRGSPVTLHALVRASALPRSALSGAMRKQLRPRGRLARRALGLGAQPLKNVIAGLNRKTLSAAPPRPALDGTTYEGTLAAVTPNVSDLVALLASSRFLWLLFVAVVLAVLIALVPLAWAWPIALAAGLGAVLYQSYLRDVGGKLSTAAGFDLTALTPEAVAALPQNDAFSLPLEGEPLEQAVPTGGLDTEQGAAFRSAAVEFQAVLRDRVPLPAPKLPLAVTHVHARLLEALEPARAFAFRYAPSLRVGDKSITEYVANYHDAPAALAPGVPPSRIVPAMAYPDIALPMYVPLKELQKDDFVPNLDLIPPDTISLMLTNPPVIEAYMVGLNHEFGRELLFREYPTDQRPSSFRQFWDPSNYVDRDGLADKALVEKVKDIRKIHEWPGETTLGSHPNTTPGDDTPRVVLVIRGELLRRYPNVLIYAQKARWGTTEDERNQLFLYDQKGEKILANQQDQNFRFPKFRAEVAPDLHFIGFDLTLDEARGDPKLEETEEARLRVSPSRLGWFFALQEVVGEPRFGLDEHAVKSSEDELKWDNLAWENLGPVSVINLAKGFVSEPPGKKTGEAAWGSNAGDLAFILYQRPALVAIHARDMLKSLAHPL